MRGEGDEIRRLAMLRNSTRSLVDGRGDLFKWREVQFIGGSVPAPRSGAGEIVFNNCLYVFGGFANGQAQNDLWMFDLGKRMWREIQGAGEKPAPRTSHSMVVDEEAGIMYVMLGSGSNFGHSNLGDIYSFDLISHYWTRLNFKGDSISPRYGQSAVFHNRKIFIFGGTYGREFSRDFFCLDLETSECKRIVSEGSEVPCARYKHAAVFVSPNKMFIHGGATTNNYQLKDSFLADLDNLSWMKLDTVGDAPPGQFAHGICYSPNTACIWLFGGCNRVECLNKLYSLDLTKYPFPKWQEAQVLPGESPPRRYFHSSFYFASTGELYVWAGKGAIHQQIRFQDMYSISVDNGALKSRQTKSPKCTLSDDLLKCLVNREMCDLEIRCSDDVIIPCHELILRCRCNPFVNSLGVSNGIISVPMHSSIISVFLIFLYTGDLLIRDVESSNFVNFLTSLLFLSQTYALGRLAHLCEVEILRKMDKTVAFKILHSAIEKSSLIWQFCEIYTRMHSNLPVDSKYDSLRSSLLRRLQSVPSSSLGKELLQCYKNSPLSFDFRLKISSLSVLSAHQLILSARSSYFRSISIHRWMREASDNLIEFAECFCGIHEDELVKLYGFLLEYLYGGEAAFFGEALPDLHIFKAMFCSDIGNYFGLSNDHLHHICGSLLTSKRAKFSYDREPLLRPMTSTAPETSLSFLPNLLYWTGLASRRNGSSEPSHSQPPARIS